jgi:hypothetical protein
MNRFITRAPPSVAVPVVADEGVRAVCSEPVPSDRNRWS